MGSPLLDDFPFYITMYNDMFAQGTIILENRPIAFYDNLSFVVIDFAGAFSGHHILKDIAEHHSPFNENWEVLWDLILSKDIKQPDPSLIIAGYDWSIPKLNTTYNFNHNDTVDLSLNFVSKNESYKIDNLKISVKSFFLSLLHLHCQQHIYTKELESKYYLQNSEHIYKRKDMIKVRKSLLNSKEVDEIFLFYMKWLEAELVNNDGIQLEKFIQTNGIQLLCLFLDLDHVFEFIKDKIDQITKINSNSIQHIVLFDIWRMIRMYYHHKSKLYKQFLKLRNEILLHLNSRDDFLVRKNSAEITTE